MLCDQPRVLDLQTRSAAFAEKAPQLITDEVIARLLYAAGVVSPNTGQLRRWALDYEPARNVWHASRLTLTGTGGVSLITARLSATTAACTESSIMTIEHISSSIALE